MKTKSNKDRTYVPCVESLHSCTEIRTHWTSTQDCSDLNQSRHRTFSLTQWLHFEMFCFLPLARWVFVLFPQNSNSRLHTRVTAWLRTELENPPMLPRYRVLLTEWGESGASNQTGQLRDELITVAIKSSKPCSLMSKWLTHEKNKKINNHKR